MKSVPRSPFTTPLSRSARETEPPIRSIFQWKKQRPPLWAMVLTAALILTCGGLVSCQAEPAADDGSTPPGEEPDDAGYAQAFYQILTQDAPFLDSNSGMTWHLSQLNEMIWNDPGMDVRAEQFAIADLDADGTPEVVILTDQHIHSEPILVLRWQDGQVYYYQEVGRGMQNLKADGTSEWSDSAFCNGFGRNRYQPSEDSGADICMADMLGEYDGFSEEPQYTLNGREVSVEEYEAALADQRAKPGAVWYELTAENAASALGVSSPATRYGGHRTPGRILPRHTPIPNS